MLNPDGTKTCPRCKLTLPTEQFYKINRSTGDGFQYHCKSCTKALAVAWQKANPEKKRKSDRARVRTPESSAKANARKKAWRMANPGKFKSSQQKYRSRLKTENPTLVRAKTAIQNNRSRARKKGVPSNMTVRDWLLLLEVFNHACAWCGTAVQLLDLDHIIPIHRGGHDVAGNIVPVCRPCNAQKSHTAPDDFAKFMGKELNEVIAKARIRDPLAGHGYDG
jgi:5-methylcytosine-specific restriction endonuclease McrA